MSTGARTDLALGKRQMSQAGNIREFDREVERAPWVDANAPNRKLIRDEEEELNKTLPENRYRAQERDRHNVPENDLRAKLRSLELLKKDANPDWHLQSFKREGKVFWTCQLIIYNHVCGTEGREWETRSAAKSSTALEALAFLEQQETASAMCKFWDSDKKMMVNRWPQPFSHDARQDMLTQLTHVDDAKAARDVYICLRDDLPGGAAITTQIRSQTEPESNPIHAGMKRTSETEVKRGTMQVIRSNKTCHLPVVPRIVEPDPDDHRYSLDTLGASVNTHPQKSLQSISSTSNGENRSIANIDDIAKYFERLMINKTSSEFFAEFHELYLRIQESAARLCKSNVQRDDFTSSLIWTFLNAHERVLAGGESSTWQRFSDITKNLKLTGATELRTVSILYLQILEVATNGSISEETDELISKLIRCILSAYEEATLGGSLRVWNLLERIIRSGDTTGAVRYLAVLHNFDSLINDVVAHGVGGSDHTDGLTSHLIQNLLETYSLVSPGGDLRAWNVLQRQYLNACTTVHGGNAASNERTEVESSISTPQTQCRENVVPECSMSEAGDTDVPFADQDLPPSKRNVKNDSRSTSNTSSMQGPSLVDFATGHKSTASISRQPQPPSVQSSIAQSAVIGSQRSNIPRAKTGFVLPSKPATKLPRDCTVAAQLGGSVTVGQVPGNTLEVPASNNQNPAPGPKLGVFHHNSGPSNTGTSKPGDRLNSRDQTASDSLNAQALQPPPSKIPRSSAGSGSRGGSMNAIFGNHLPASVSSTTPSTANLPHTRASGRTTSTRGRSDGGRHSRGGR